MPKRKAGGSQRGEGDNPRLADGRCLVNELRTFHPELRLCQVIETPSDGLCFLHAALQQLDIESTVYVWKVAMMVLKAMAQTHESWKLHLSDTDFTERMQSLHDFGLARAIETRRMTLVDQMAFAYILDRCCGVAERDWASPRLYIATTSSYNRFWIGVGDIYSY